MGNKTLILIACLCLVGYMVYKRDSRAVLKPSTTKGYTVVPVVKAD